MAKVKLTHLHELTLYEKQTPVYTQRIKTWLRGTENEILGQLKLLEIRICLLNKTILIKFSGLRHTSKSSGYVTSTNSDKSSRILHVSRCF